MLHLLIEGIKERHCTIMRKISVLLWRDKSQWKQSLNTRAFSQHMWLKSSVFIFAMFFLTPASWSYSQFWCWTYVSIFCLFIANHSCGFCFLVLHLLLPKKIPLFKTSFKYVFVCSGIFGFHSTFDVNRLGLKWGLTELGCIFAFAMGIQMYSCLLAWVDVVSVHPYFNSIFFSYI